MTNNDRNVFQYLSDLNLSHNPGKTPLIFPVQNTFPEHLILAGDIGSPFSLRFWKFLQRESMIFSNVFFVLGNTDYWNSDIDMINKFVISMVKRLKLVNVHFLNNTCFELNNIKIIGSTLWHELSKDSDINNLRDYQYIKSFSLDKSNMLHRESKDFIQRELQTSKKTIVITHHTPSIKDSINPDITDEIVLQSVGSDCEDLLEKCDFWVYGHSHYNFPTNPKLKTNQLGYHFNKPLKGFNKKAFFVI